VTDGVPKRVLEIVATYIALNAFVAASIPDTLAYNARPYDEMTGVAGETFEPREEVGAR
jgi:hypothetical protein